eukprot:Em0002g375a
MLSFATCAKVPVPGCRRWGDGGLVEVEGRVVWGGYGGYGGVHMLDEVRSKWSRVADGGEYGGTLAVCGGRLVWVGGDKSGVRSKEVKELRGGRWSLPDMLVGCDRSCVLSVSGGGMVVMGGIGDGGWLNVVQVFDGGTQTWHRGPSLPKPCCLMSAVVHGDLVFVMGGRGMGRAVWCANIRDLFCPKGFRRQPGDRVYPSGHIWDQGSAGLPWVPTRRATTMTLVMVSGRPSPLTDHGTKVALACLGLDGKVVEGMDVVRKMEAVGSEDGDTSKPVVIKDCGMAK